MTQKTAISPTRNEDYPQWYQQVITAADLAENSPVRGCMVIKPWGYALWEQIQQYLDTKFKETGHVNAYFPLLIPLSNLEKEAQHVEGFAKECAVVTHHKLVADGNGGLIPDGELEEPLIIRPTSETIIGEMYAKWVKSYRDLPLLINQWANVMRWEMRTRMFLRTSEFLWQEGHTAHATATEAMEETRSILDLYADFAQEILAIPVIKGEKPCFERFPGAVNTFTIEAMMQDGKALQAGTSHFLGQNFAKASKIEFLNKDGVLENAWTTSWGVSTRLIGGLIMTHSDDNGLIAPPRIAPMHIVIIPIFRNDEEFDLVIKHCNQLADQLKSQLYHGSKLRITIDKRDMRGGDKSWQWIKKGVPLRVEVGPRDIEKQSVVLLRRDQEVKQKHIMSNDELASKVISILDEIQANIYQKALEFKNSHLVELSSFEKFKAYFADSSDSKVGGFVSCYAADDARIEEFIKPLKVTARVIPLNQPKDQSGICIFTGDTVKQKIIFAKSY
jgi:prolyl-tRNA synthetase